MSGARLFVLALRRSGSTVFWETLRQDRRFRAFNEPFNPLIRRVSDESWMGMQRRHYSEIEALMQADPRRFWQVFDAIYELQELRTGLSDTQREYLRFLLCAGDDILLETTRCHFKVADLRAAGGDRSVLVHLYRSPEGFATSHLIPSATDARRKLLSASRRAIMLARGRAARLLRTRSFWTRRSRYGWTVEEVIGDGEHSAFFTLAREHGLDTRELLNLPAVGRLLAYWAVAFRTIERDGPAHFGDRFLSVNLESWLREPAPIIARIYNALGREQPAFDYSHLRPPSMPFDSDNPLWQRYCSMLQIDTPEVRERL